MLPVIIVLVIIAIGLIIYNISIHKKIQKFKNMNQKITNLNVVQDFMNAIGQVSSVDKKIKTINDILIEKYEIKYSTIVVFNGVEYEVKASNVDTKHWKALQSLHNVDIFKDSIETASPKYITVNNENERLPYQETELARAKSSIFFPLYIDNVYIGYWIIESGTPHDFDNVDITVLEVIKENIVSVLKTVVHQKTLETIVRKDTFTGLYSEEYLYGEGKKNIDKHTISTICMFTITNIQQINRRYSRELGNKVITEISKYVKENISNEYIFIRYMGPKFVIVFSGVQIDSVEDFLNNIKEKIEGLEIHLTKEEIQQMELQVKVQIVKNQKVEVKQIARPKLNMVISSYYKGTGIEEVLKKLEQYLNEADINESDITSI